MKRFVRLHVILLIGGWLFSTGCSSLRSHVMRDASRSLADAAAVSFNRESDLELAAGAMPFALKTLDMLAIQQPENPDILLAAARAYIQYSHAFLDWEARQREIHDVEAAENLRKRSVGLYLRGRDYAAAALAITHPEPMKHLEQEPDKWLARMKARDVPALYWMGAGWASAISVNPSDMNEMARLPLVEKIMRRALALDPDFELGALYEFFIAFEGSRSPAMGGDPARAEEYFQQALKADKGQLASPYVSLATSVMIQTQDAERFRELMEKALMINPDDQPDFRLANVLAREKARWYLDHMDMFFLLDEGASP